MPIRHFNGESDEIVFPANSSSGAITMAVYFRPSQVNWAVALSTNATSLYAKALGTRESLGDLVAMNFDESVLPPKEAAYRYAANEWLLLALTLTAKTATPRFHIFKGGSWTHVNATSSFVEASGNTETTTRLGRRLSESPFWFKGDLAAAGIRKSSLTDAEVEALSTPGLKAVWPTILTAWCVTLDQASTATAVPDLTGNGNAQSAITGTSVTAEEPPIPFVSHNLTLLGVGA